LDKTIINLRKTGPETSAEAYSQWAEGRNHSEALGPVRQGGIWFLNNLHVVKYCIEHTDLCKVALSRTDDTVLPALLHLIGWKTGYEQKLTADPVEMRLRILEGIDRYIEMKHGDQLVESTASSGDSSTGIDIGAQSGQGEYTSEEEEENFPEREGVNAGMRRRFLQKGSFIYSDEESENSFQSSPSHQ
jgi:hypothetical protein